MGDDLYGATISPAVMSERTSPLLGGTGQLGFRVIARLSGAEVGFDGDRASTTGQDGAGTAPASESRRSGTRRNARLTAPEHRGTSPHRAACRIVPPSPADLPRVRR